MAAAVVAGGIGGTAWVASAAKPAVPTAAQVNRILRAATEVGTGGNCPKGKSCAEHLHQMKRLTVPDGHGGFLTAVLAVRWPTADGYGQYVLFWHDTTFLGSQNLTPLPKLGREATSIEAAKVRGHGIELTFANYSPKNPLCCPSLKPVVSTYRWDGSRLVNSRRLPRSVTLNLTMVVR
jgi:hypothetical protein